MLQVLLGKVVFKTNALHNIASLHEKVTNCFTLLLFMKSNALDNNFVVTKITFCHLSWAFLFVLIFVNC